MTSRPNILIVGAGEAGRALLSDYSRIGRAHRIAGFIDDDPAKAGTAVDGKPVLGTTASITAAIGEHAVGQVIVAIPSAGHRSVRTIVSGILDEHPHVSIHIIPSAERFFDAVPISPSLKKLPFGELFERDEITVDMDSIKEAFSGRTVLVTGAGGSIGSELCRQLLKFGIGRLVAVGRGEHSIYCLIKSLREFLELMERRPQVSYRIADVRDLDLLEGIVAEFRPDIVFHAAAHKHVPLMEYNEAEAVKNNVGGTWNVLELAARYGVGRFILVSTDKAVHPANVMGATKRIAEILCDHYHRSRGLNCASVRFGNVIDSRGSVLPLFREQIEKGGPVTVTHPEVTRFFMTIPEASLLVLNAAAYAAGGEVFILEMGKQHRIDDIARRLIEFYGLVPDRDIRIVYTGLRPGEKLHEDLHYTREVLTATRNDKIRVLAGGAAEVPPAALERFLREVLPGITARTGDGVREAIASIVPLFPSTPPSAGESNRLVN
ncbi:MAG: polysaccharide biosynthesis protein [Spirochaetes bacterium]|nr:polysaccharide biosynthesis protein [Spirochaetota bacterium]